jgi:sugar phosphate isomerase/epimerase
MTVAQWSFDEAVEASAQAGIRWLGPWRHKLAGADLRDRARTLRHAGVRVSSLCRGGFFTPLDAAELAASDADNRRAVEQAAELGTDVLVLVCGPARGADLQAARSQVAAGIERLLPHAIEHGVRLAIEPLHPMLITERSVIVTLGEALDLAERFDAGEVGVIVDAYHVFWDPQVERQIARAGARILGFHVSDWVTPTGDATASRAMIGDGTIDLRGLRQLVERAGYDGPIEIEIISAELEAQPGDDVLDRALARFGDLMV